MSQTAFLCKFCHAVMLGYNVATGEYIEIESKKKHVCNQKRDFSNFVKVIRCFDDTACSLCHSSREERTEVYFKEIGEKGTSRQVICFACAKKIFYPLAGSE